jgi:hypothetical protein
MSIASTQAELEAIDVCSAKSVFDVMFSSFRLLVDFICKVEYK